MPSSITHDLFKQKRRTSKRYPSEERPCSCTGLDGIQQKLYPTKASDRSFSESDQKAMNIGNLPLNLDDALTHFENSTWIQSVLGKKFCEEYAAAKKEEWLNYMRQVSEWEISQYLYKI